MYQPCGLGENANYFHSLHRRHVHADLRAYLCTHEECGMTMFEQKRAWIDHEMEKHWRSWFCYLCKFSSDQQSEVKLHLERYHPETLGEELEDTMTYMTSCPLDYLDASRCPLCDWDKSLASKSPITTVSRASFMGHLAQHLEQLALFAIPRVGSGENFGSVESNLAANRGSQASRSTENSRSAEDKLLTGVATTTRADPTEVASSPMQQTYDSQAASFNAIGLAFPSQPQDHDATFAWMTSTEPHDSGAVDGQDVDGQDGQGGLFDNEIYDEISEICKILLNMSLKVADPEYSERNIRKASSMSHGLLIVIDNVANKLTSCQSRTSRAHAYGVLQDCITRMRELRVSVIDFGTDVPFVRRRELSHDIRRKISDVTSLLLTAATQRHLSADEDLPRDQSDKTRLQDETSPVVSNTNTTASVIGTTPSMIDVAQQHQGTALETVEAAKQEPANDLGDSEIQADESGEGSSGDEAADIEARRDFMTELSYPGMFNRQESIRPPYTNTFEWLWSQRNFANILESDEKLFWISGQPGYGKSTMMRMIECDRRTQESLSSWANGRLLFTSSFYFDRMGPTLQRSVRGLLRSLIYQFSQQMDIGNGSKAPTHGWYDDGPIEYLVTLLETILRRPDACFFMMIDGVGECAGSMEDLDQFLDLILSFSKADGVKICVAGWRLTRVQQRLGGFPCVRLDDAHELTYDITFFVKSKLDALEIEASLREYFTRNLIARCQGSFSKAKVLVDMVQLMSAEGVDEKTMERRINKMLPSDRGTL